MYSFCLRRKINAASSSHPNCQWYRVARRERWRSRTIILDSVLEHLQWLFACSAPDFRRRRFSLCSRALPLNLKFYTRDALPDGALNSRALLSSISAMPCACISSSTTRRNFDLNFLSSKNGRTRWSHWIIGVMAGRVHDPCTTSMHKQLAL